MARFAEIVLCYRAKRTKRHPSKAKASTAAIANIFGRILIQGLQFDNSSLLRGKTKHGWLWEFHGGLGDTLPHEKITCQLAAKMENNSI